MRGFAIFVWCLVTLGMFYSAWAFKAPEIEQDITAKVSSAVTKAGGDAIDVDVDGRHVNLRGIAADEAQKSNFLEVADKTHGALGPIDGLMLPSAPAKTFLTASLSGDDVVLSGVVGSAEERDMILSDAKAIGFVNITDNMNVGSATSGLGDAAKSGLARLADLQSGHLYVSDDERTLSGNAPTPEIAAAAGALGDGWQSFVAGPELEDPRIATLSADLADRESQLNTMDATLVARDARIDELTEIRNTMQVDLDLKTSDLESLRASSEMQAGQLADLTDTVAQRDGRIVELEGQLSDGALKTGNLETQMSTMAASLALLRQDGGETTANLEAALTEKTDEANRLQTEVTDLSGQVATLEEENGALNGKVLVRNGQITGLEARMAAATANAADLSGSLGALEDEHSALKGKLLVRDGQITGLNARMAALNATSSAQSDDLAARDTQIEELNGQVAGLNEEVEGLKASQTTLSGNLAARDSDLASLTTELNGRIANQASTITTLEGEIEANALELERSEAFRSAAVSRSESLAGQLADKSDELNVAKAEVKSLGADKDALSGKVTDLEVLLAQKDDRLNAISTDAPEPVSNMEQTMAVCNQTAQDLLAEGQINFVTGSAEVLADSTDLLERITGVVLACSNESTSLQISGHTDDRGSEEANQNLSERRAASVAAFMVNRGVEADALKAVGLGESQPIADNATSEGRAANRRISFEFSVN